MPSGVSSFLRGLMTTAVATPSSKKEGEKSFLLFLSPQSTSLIVLVMCCVSWRGAPATEGERRMLPLVFCEADELSCTRFFFFPCGGSETQSVIRTHRGRTSALQYDDEDRVRAFSFLPSGLSPGRFKGAAPLTESSASGGGGRRGDIHPSSFSVLFLSSFRYRAKKERKAEME